MSTAHSDKEVAPSTGIEAHHNQHMNAEKELVRPGTNNTHHSSGDYSPRDPKNGVLELSHRSGSDFDDESGVDGHALPFTEKLCLKLDLHLLTPMFFLNFLSLMGRTNIGAALIQGLPQDLKLTSQAQFTATVMPLIMLIVAEIPSNLAMRWLERRAPALSYMRYLSLITVGLGVVTIGQAFVQSAGALYATRFLVGIFDSGLIPGCVYVLSLYYPGVHLQWRMSMLMVANIIANIVSNILAYAIAQIHTNGYLGWRWIFIIEGCITIGIGLICCYSNISRPETSTFLTQLEKDTIAQNVESRTTTIGVVAEWKLFFANILNYIWVALYVLTCATTYSVAVFAPTFVKTFHVGASVPYVQGQVVPIFVVSAVACLLAAWAADRTNHRAAYAIGGYLFTIVGYAILFSVAHNPNVSMLGLYLVSIGTYVSLPMVWTLTCINLATPFQKAIGCGFVVGIGNVGGFVSAWIFRASEGPAYKNGMMDGIIITVVALVLTAAAWGYILMVNRRETSAPVKQTGKNVLANGTVFKYRA